MSHNHKIENANRQIRGVTKAGIVVNIVLSVIKIAGGFFGGSMALVADGVHSFSDMATDVVVLLGVYFGSKEADKKHPYGHGRIETFAALAIAMVLAFVGVGMILRSAVGIAEIEMVRPGVLVIVIALISIFVKEILYRATRRIAVVTHSSALYANAWHHRSDALSSVVVVGGLVSMFFGFKYGDRIAAIVVGFMILMVGLRIIGDNFVELSEGAVDERTTEEITRIIKENDQIRQWHKLRTRRVGREIFLELHILVDPDLNISSAHQIAENLENALHAQMARPVNITVHIEPDLPELRK